MRYLNLFRKITNISTRHCFNYNSTIFFCVPKQLVSKAVGSEGKNVKKLNEILRKKIRIIPIPRAISHVKSFISEIVSPIIFKDIQINEDEIILSSSSKNKAALIGRNKRRLYEMQKIIKSYFNKEFRIV